MSNQISLTIPNDDPIALRAFGNALEEMAVAHGAESRKSVAAMTVKIDGTEAAQAVRGVLEEFTAPPVQGEQYGEFVPFPDPEGPTIQDMIDDGTLPAPDYNLDADGLPWDARIHSGNQERNADNTWRVRRRPKDLTPEQWAEQVAQVRDELFALMAIPVVDPVVDHGPDFEDGPEFEGFAERCGEDGVESPAAVFGAPAPVEVPTVTAELPPAPPIADPVPPVVAADPVPPAPTPLPPVTAASADVPATLAELMTWLTSKAPSDDAGRAARLEQINGIVARHGLVTLSQLQKRLDLIPQVHADLMKELGQ